MERDDARELVDEEHNAWEVEAVERCALSSGPKRGLRSVAEVILESGWPKCDITEGGDSGGSGPGKTSG